MFVNLMTDTHINISSNMINIIEQYYNIEIPSLIHIYKHGMCITQNVNNTSNISIYIKKELIKTFNINREFAFYNKEKLSFLSDLKIINNNNNNYIYINHKLNKINFISSCNFCKNIHEIEFTETQIPNNIIQDIDLGWIKKKISDHKGDCKILLSEQINGIVIKINVDDIVIYINVV